MIKQKKGDIKIEGQSRYFKADFVIMHGLYKAQERARVKENIRSFNIKPVKAQDKNSMGIRFHELGNTTIIHIDTTGAPTQQLLVSKDIDMKRMRSLPLNDTYKQLITQAFKLAGGKEGILRKIKNAIK